MEIINDVFRILKSYSYLGEMKADNGTLLIGKAPHIAPLAWLHRIFAPLTNAQIDGLGIKLGMNIPSSYRNFLKHSNGLGVFNTNLCLYGLRTINNRTIEASYQPFDILDVNVLERPMNSKNSFLYIGSYSWDLSRLYIDADTNKVYLSSSRDNATPKYEWINFDTMLETEIKRIITLFDDKGVKVIKGSTLPV
ncbi:MAG TPA: SMI1/KNR4 family protein [Puia sp.]|nr:SMI1/KNR4 family protein [Puia sp.]